MIIKLCSLEFYENGSETYLFQVFQVISALLFIAILLIKFRIVFFLANEVSKVFF